MTSTDVYSLLGAFALGALAVGLGLLPVLYSTITELRACRQDNRRLMTRLGQYHGIDLGWRPPTHALDSDDGMRDIPAASRPALRYVAKIPSTDKE